MKLWQSAFRRWTNQLQLLHLKCTVKTKKGLQRCTCMPSTLLISTNLIDTFMSLQFAYWRLQYECWSTRIWIIKTYQWITIFRIKQINKLKNVREQASFPYFKYHHWLPHCMFVRHVLPSSSSSVMLSASSADPGWERYSTACKKKLGKNIAVIHVVKSLITSERQSALINDLSRRLTGTATVSYTC